jgi:putative ABC transport system permease protein
MTISTFILKNALRNKRRAALSISSVAVSLFLLVTLQVALRELTLPPPSAGAELRVAVRNKISIANLLPARQRRVIEKIPGVVAVSPFTWFGGRYKNEEGMSFAQFAMDANKLKSVFGEARMDEAGYERFEAKKDACVLGKITADKYHLKVGDRITLDSTVYPGSLSFEIAGIYAGTPDDRNMLFRQDYLDESIGAPGYVGMWWLKVQSADVMGPVIKAINAAFENTSAEVRAESERNFQLGFISMLGNVKTLIASISTVVVFTLVLVSASTMSMAVRERFRELAILKALGFRRRELFVFILAESFGLAATGALLGIGGAYALYTYGDIGKLTHGIFVSFEVTPRIMGVGALVASVLGVVSALVPSMAVARMSVVNGLKTLD